VSGRSAILNLNENAAISGTHITMTKFADKNDTGYRRVSNQIWLWVDEIQNAGSRPQNRSETHAQTQAPRMLTWDGTFTNNKGPIIQGGRVIGGIGNTVNNS
jgi:hypothetical protein